MAYSFPKTDIHNLHFMPKYETANSTIEMEFSGEGNEEVKTKAKSSMHHKLRTIDHDTFDGDCNIPQEESSRNGDNEFCERRCCVPRVFP